ncbi:MULTISPECIES: hypothetical protein [Desulfitobacterium]|uniref:Uncharacterized protein n=1 Tax=Desulfitobacterium dehalogenans (strain ATCC 51507 / DSM 9161 / JW/IU-DC1) TaxID=756499 RepID=I4A5C3_DESDJ|nr:MULTISPECIES: hypothetical protein [Desulfitobacterium]AFL99157.1 hypothetical protein Desde_0710 [Desulfitobacterium dehalogenans ATCC 51507]
MRTKVILIFVLTVMVLSSLTVGTLSNYNSVSSFGISITPH